MPTIIAIAGALVVAAWLIVAPVLAARSGDDVAFAAAIILTIAAGLLVLVAWLSDWPRERGYSTTLTSSVHVGAGVRVDAVHEPIGRYGSPSWGPDVVVVHEHHHHAPPADDGPETYRHAPSVDTHHHHDPIASEPPTWDPPSSDYSSSHDYSGDVCTSDTSWSGD